jgi:hypothetical protein
MPFSLIVHHSDMSHIYNGTSPRISRKPHSIVLILALRPE